MNIYHVRPTDLHAPGEHCNNYDCSAVVMKHDYDALVVLLEQADRLLGLVKQAGNDELRPEEISELYEEIMVFMRTAESAP